MQFNVMNRFTNQVQFTAEIDCTEDTPTSHKLRLAVEWAIKNKADLSGADLSGANLSGANLSGADLFRADLFRASLSEANLYEANLYEANFSGANLSGANLSGADLFRADLSGANLWIKRVGSVDRGDYTFEGWTTPLGGLVIKAGCRTMTESEWRLHIQGYTCAIKHDRTKAIIDAMRSLRDALHT